eukprot:scaffold317_cov260-Pinguiococcus_pyrenoidosus.AAC.49
MHEIRFLVSGNGILLNTLLPLLCRTGPPRLTELFRFVVKQRVCPEDVRLDSLASLANAGSARKSPELSRWILTRQAHAASSAAALKTRLAIGNFPCDQWLWRSSGCGTSEVQRRPCAERLRSSPAESGAGLT